MVDTLITVGKSPEQNIQQFCEAVGDCPPPNLEPQTLEPGEAIATLRNTDTQPFRFRITPGHTERRRHLRKYAEGELGTDKSFYFTHKNRQIKASRS